MTFEDAVKLVNSLSEELSTLAYLKDELAELHDKAKYQKMVESSRNVEQMILELTQDFGSGSGLDRIKEELVIDEE